jgi:hypothetical protein
MPHLLGMFVCNLVIAFSSMDALEATVGLAAYSAVFQISRALAATILPAVIAAGLGALPLAGALLGELGDGFSLLSYNWLPTG